MTAPLGRDGARRVLMVAHAFPRFEGDLPGSFVLRLAVSLRDENVRTLALAPSGPGLAAEAVLDGIPVRRYRYALASAQTLAYAGNMHERARTPSGAVALGGLLLAGAAGVRRWGRRADLVHAHWWFPGAVQAAAADRRPLVVTIHGTDLRLAASSAAARRLCARVLGAAAAVTTVSRTLRDEVLRIAPSAGPRLEVAPMPVDVDCFPFRPGAGGREELLFVGRLDAQKGADVAVRAVARLRSPLPLRIVGSGGEQPRLATLARELGIADRVRFEPELAPRELAAAYRRAAALLVPSRYEGLGLVAVEAQLSGTPVVVSAAGGLLDVVEDGFTGRTFPVGDASACAAAVQAVLDAPDATVAMADHARQAALDRFSPAAVAQTYVRVYEEALCRAAGRPEGPPRWE